MTQASISTTYLNAMEPLALAEIQRQIKSMPREVVETINVTEAIAYTLNRLPPLYSTTEEGYSWQQKRAEETLMDLIKKVASWGIRAATRPTTNFVTPLMYDVKNSELLEVKKAESSIPKRVDEVHPMFFCKGCISSWRSVFITLETKTL